MGLDIAEQHVSRFLDRVYDAAVSSRAWPDVLSQITAMFDGSFADIFTRSHDRQHFGGLAHGLDRADYEDRFLGYWFTRNVWGNTHPVKIAGEVLSTRSMVDVDELRRSEIYNEYLHPRDLHEGLRLSLWVDESDIQDISVLRPWSRGAFGSQEIALGTALLPHLQRAAIVSRRLRRLDFERATAAVGAGNGHVAVFAFDAAGRVFWLNAAAEDVLAEASVLKLCDGGLEGPSTMLTREIHDAVARAVGTGGRLRRGGTVSLRSSTDRRTQNLVVLPASNAADWALSRPPSAIAFMRGSLGASMSKSLLQRIFPLTDAEATLALQLVAGQSLKDITATSRRSMNTLRTHLARLMEKTKTNKQTELIKLLCDISSSNVDQIVGRLDS